MVGFESAVKHFFVEGMQASYPSGRGEDVLEGV